MILFLKILNSQWLKVNGKRFFTFCLLPFTLYFSSCTEEIKLDLNDSDVRLVVDGGIGMDVGVHTVRLSKTMSYFSTDMTVPYVSGAVVTITEFDRMKEATGNVFELNENPGKPGHYETESTVFGKQGYTYRLDVSNVEVGGHVTYSAEAFFPYIADKIDSVRPFWGPNLFGVMFGFELDSTDIHTGWNLCFWAQDPPTREYYVFIPYQNGVALNDTLTNFFMMDDGMISEAGIGLDGLPIEFISDSSWVKIKEGDTLGLEIRSISEDYYRYINEFNTVYQGANPMFGGAPANVRGNVSNGAIGYFWAYGNRKAFGIASRRNLPPEWVFGYDEAVGGN
ncbi:MAG: DUF4249 domain-containing protein [Bacteroidales bacterium]|jgi:hypothetical protein|nr:DUF4249 domain-containing protein [Bacteroidales bacterium]